MEGEQTERLLKAASPVLAELVAGALTQEGIPFITKTRGAGTLYGGGFYGVDLYVAEANFPLASEILLGLTTGDIPKEEAQQQSALEGLGLLPDD